MPLEHLPAACDTNMLLSFWLSAMSSHIVDHCILVFRGWYKCFDCYCVTVCCLKPSVSCSLGAWNNLSTAWRLERFFYGLNSSVTSFCIYAASLFVAAITSLEG